jgi:hypothetical protein
MGERKPAVENGVMNYTSVSAIKKFTTCEAAWVLRYILRLPDPSGKGALESDECHKRTEHYLRTGENVLGDIERRALKRGLFPTPNDPKNPRPDDLLVEEYFELLDCEGVPFIVKMDCVDPRLVESQGLLVLNDWKFKKSIRKYGTTKEKLLDPEDEDGVQMIGYGEEMRREIRIKGRFPGTKIIRLRHVQVDKTEDDAEEVFVDVPVDDFEHLWARLNPIVARMKLVAKATGPEQVKGNKAACWKFGGCAFQKECPHFKSKENQSLRLAALFTPRSTRGEVDMGMLNNLKNKTAIPQGYQPAAGPAPTNPPQGGSGTVPVATVQKAPARSLIIDESTLSDVTLRAQQAATVASVLPPDAPKSNPVAASMPAAPAQVQAQPILKESVEAPVKRTRRTRAEMESAAFAAQNHGVTAVRPEAFTLYIGCAPKSGATSLTPYVDSLEAQALAGINEQLKTDFDDIRLVTGSEVGYGKWKAVMAALAKNSPPAPGKYKVLSLGMDERVDAVVAALETLAVDVVTR